MKKVFTIPISADYCFSSSNTILLPSYIGSRIEKQLNDSLKPSSQTVNVESQPGFKILYGELIMYMVLWR